MAKIRRALIGETRLGRSLTEGPSRSGLSLIDIPATGDPKTQPLNKMMQSLGPPLAAAVLVA